jgi:hypothetical protein
MLPMHLKLIKVLDFNLLKNMFLIFFTWRYIILNYITMFVFNFKFYILNCFCFVSVFSLENRRQKSLINIRLDAQFNPLNRRCFYSF